MNSVIDVIMNDLKYKPCLPGRGAKEMLRNLHDPGGNSGKVKRPLCLTAALNNFHLSSMRWAAKSKRDPSLLVGYLQPSVTTCSTLAARSCESFDTPIVLSSMYFTIFLATSSSLTRAHLKEVEEKNLKYVLNHLVTMFVRI